MKDKYTIEKTMQPGGIMYAVVFEQQYRFVVKTEKGANKIAARLNRIHNKRISEAA